jgi:hypothetical protein
MARLSTRRRAGPCSTAIKGNASCTDWKEKPGSGCTRYDKTGDAVTIFEVNCGQIRAKVVGTAAGNAEKLAP